jgi:molybdate transport repressor ModE-like protein
MAWNDRIGRRLKLRDLHILLAVAQAGSMAKAAKQLAISQPAISKAVGDMEHVLGIPLLERGPQGVVPTQYGRALISRGLAVFDELRQGINDIEFLADPTAGEVRLGSTEPLGASLITAAIDRISRRYPRITFHVTLADIAALHRDLQERNVEFVVSRVLGPLDDRQLKTDILYDDPFVVAAGMHNPWARRRNVKLADLVNEQWVLSSETFIGSLVAEAFRANGLEPPRAAVCTMSLNMRNSLLATGRFISAVPGSMLRFPSRHPSIKALPIELSTMRRPIGIMALPNRILSPVAELFITALREVVNPPAEDKHTSLHKH